MNEKFNWEHMEAYAHGYWDGRNVGTPDDLEDEGDVYRYVYRKGYDHGVADFIENGEK